MKTMARTQNTMASFYKDRFVSVFDVIYPINIVYLIGIPNTTQCHTV